MLWLADFSRGLLAHLADVSARAVCLALVAMVLLWALRARSASVRHAVWTGVLCGMLSLPLASLHLPSVPVRILPVAEDRMPPVQPHLATPGPATAVADRPAAPMGQTRAPYWQVLACAVYLAVSLGLFGRLMLGFMVTRRLLRGATWINDPRAAGCLEQLGRGAPGLRESKSASVPMTMGWWRPCIVLPGGWESWRRGSSGRFWRTSFRTCGGETG